MERLKQPVFILGNPRSGTTLFRLMLTAHPNIIIPPECGFALWYYKKYFDTDFGATGYEDFLNDLFKAKKIELWNLDRDEVASMLNNRKPESYDMVVSCLYQYYGEQQKKEVLLWGDKNNFYIDFIDELAGLFPKAKVIHLVRDGRSVACSYLGLAKKKISSPHAPKLPSDIVSIANEWKLNVNKIEDGLKQFEESDTLRVRFEDLVSDPTKSLERVCDFLELKFSQKMLHYHELDTDKGKEPKEFNQWKAKNNLPPQTNEINRFMDELSLEERQSFINIAKRELEEFNYPL